MNIFKELKGLFDVDARAFWSQIVVESRAWKVVLIQGHVFVSTQFFHLKYFQKKSNFCFILPHKSWCEHQTNGLLYRIRDAGRVRILAPFSSDHRVSFWSQDGVERLFRFKIKRLLKNHSQIRSKSYIRKQAFSARRWRRRFSRSTCRTSAGWAFRGLWLDVRLSSIERPTATTTSSNRSRATGGFTRMEAARWGWTETFLKSEMVEISTFIQFSAKIRRSKN